MRLAYEAGNSNLYRINPDGAYDPVTYLAPEDPETATYTPVGGSGNCSEFVFSSPAHYPGIPAIGTIGAGKENLYEWEEGTLRNAGLVPAEPSGEVPVIATPGRTNAVSEDASHVFFSAKRESQAVAGEKGKTGVFARIDGAHTVDVSASETSTPSIGYEANPTTSPDVFTGATYQWATPSGSKVFFTANPGIATNGASAEGTSDLYEYDFAKPEGERLTDLTPTTATGGAQVKGVLGASDDGTSVYLMAAGQLVAGRGRTLAQNESQKTESLYRVTGGETSFVATVPAGSLPSSQSSPEGRYLAFESTANVTGYDSDGAREAYLYDADQGAEGKTLCASCRQDGLAPVGPAGGKALTGESALPVGSGVRYLTVSGGQAHLFFNSNDALAPGAIEGQNNVYEYSHGQVFRLTGERGRQNEKHYAAVFAGAARDGSDAYLFSPETLSWEDGDGRISVYDARVGGGFPEPAPPAAPCDPDAEGSCRHPAAPPPALPGGGASTFNGPGNVKAKKAKKRKAHKKRHKHHKKKHHHKGKKHKHKGKKKRHKNNKRAAKSNRRAHR